MPFNNENFGQYKESIVKSRFNYDTGGEGYPPPPPTEVYLIDNDGAYLLDADGNYLVEIT